MTTDNYRLACELRDRLLAELNENETFKAFQHAQEIVNFLTAAEDRSVASSSSQVKAATIKNQRSRPGSLASAVRETAVTYIRGKGARARSGEIYQAVLDAGISVPGQKPVSVVSSYLSGSHIFDNTDEGYGLTEWIEAHIESEAPDSGEPSGALRANGAEPLSP